MASKNAHPGGFVQNAAICALLALLAAGCSTNGAGPVERRNESGFTIREDVRTNARVRSKFSSAMQAIEEKRYEEGIAMLLEVREELPDATTVHIDLAIAYVGAGDLENAEASLTRALELNPRHPAAHNELGIVYRKTGRFALARDSYERALDVYPDFHFARRNLAILCDLYLADMSCALEHYERYVKAVPDDEQAEIWVADLRNRMGQ